MQNKGQMYAYTKFTSNKVGVLVCVSFRFTFCVDSNNNRNVCRSRDSLLVLVYQCLVFTTASAFGKTKRRSLLVTVVKSQRNILTNIVIPVVCVLAWF